MGTWKIVFFKKSNFWKLKITVSDRENTLDGINNIFNTGKEKMSILTATGTNHEEKSQIISIGSEKEFYNIQPPIL